MNHYSATTTMNNNAEGYLSKWSCRGIMAEEEEEMDYQDPPLDLTLSSSLNDSFGWNNDDDDDNCDAGTNNKNSKRAFDEEFERIYSGDDHADAVNYKYNAREDKQNQRSIHRTSFSYTQQCRDLDANYHDADKIRAQGGGRQIHFQSKEKGEQENNNDTATVSVLTSAYNGGLNPYHYGSTNAAANAGINTARQTRQNVCSNVNSNKATDDDYEQPTTRAKEQPRSNRESIFRSLPQNNNKVYTNITSPSAMIQRTHSNKNTTHNTTAVVVTPNSSMFTSSTDVRPSAAVTHHSQFDGPSPSYPSLAASSSHNNYNANSGRQMTPPQRGILRNPTAISALTQTTVHDSSYCKSYTSSAYSRNSRSVSRGNARSRHGHGREGSSSVSRRSVSRSVSRHRDGSRRHRGDDEGHDESLFRGAQLIKEQLIRSMAEVDRNHNRVMDNRVDIAGVDSKRAAASAACDASIDFDYSNTILPSSSNRSSCQQRIEVVRNSSSTTDRSSIHSRLESESQRLDSLIKIFAQSGSVNSSGAPSSNDVVSPTHNSNQLWQSSSQQQKNQEQVVMVNKSSSSDKENEEYPLDEEWEDRGGNNSTASPKSACVDLTNAEAPSSKSFFKQPSEESADAGIGYSYARQYFQEDEPKSSFVHPADNSSSPIIVNNSKKEIEQQQQPPSIIPSPSQHNLAAQYHQQKQLRLDKQTNDALSHARTSGSLWRSLVGNHVRFPSSWDTLLPPTAPAIERPNLKWSKWHYPARHRVKGDRKLNSAEYGVRNRRSGGRILMNILVREMHSPHVCREIAIGCFHPNAKGIRIGDVVPEVEDVREVWMGVRWVIPTHCSEPELDGCEEDVECFIDGFLTQKRKMLDYQTMGSPLGRRKDVNNENVRAVFGDQPPLTTVNLYEDELAEVIKANDVKRLSSLPGLMLLKFFLFSK